MSEGDPPGSPFVVLNSNTPSQRQRAHHGLVPPFVTNRWAGVPMTDRRPAAGEPFRSARFGYDHSDIFYFLVWISITVATATKTTTLAQPATGAAV